MTDNRFTGIRILPTEYLPHYLKVQPISIEKHLNRIKDLPPHSDTISRSMAEAAVYSSMIENNPINWEQYLEYMDRGIGEGKLLYRDSPDMDSAFAGYSLYSVSRDDEALDADLKAKFPWMLTNRKYLTEINDLIVAYRYVADHALTIQNLKEAHRISTQTVLTNEKYRGAFRDRDASVFSGGVKIFSGVPVERVQAEMDKLFADIERLVSMELSPAEAFHFASLIHLQFAQIHPFADGNGRSARLLEKWFIARKTGSKAWTIPSERLYQTRIRSYYQNINMGSAYETVDYDLCIPFLLMLPMALTLNNNPHG